MEWLVDFVLTRCNFCGDAPRGREETARRGESARVRRRTAERGRVREWHV